MVLNKKGGMIWRISANKEFICHDLILKQVRF